MLIEGDMMLLLVLAVGIERKFAMIRRKILKFKDTPRVKWKFMRWKRKMTIVFKNQ